MTRIHKILKGDGAGVYLPFALSRLAALRQIHKSGFFSQTFIIDDAKVHVRKVGDDEYIDIEMQGGFYFEFQTSGNPPLTTIVNDPAQGPLYTYNAITIATDVTTKEGAVNIAPYVRLNGRSAYGNSLNNRSLQVQLIDESVKNPTQSKGLRTSQKHTKSLYESYAARHSHTGTGYRNTTLHYAPFQWVPETGNSLTHTERDVGYDEQWAFGDKKSPVITSTYYTHLSADWPRHAGYQTVVDEKWGTRTFGIMIDFSGRFHVFPVAAVRPLTESTLYQSVEDKYTRDAYPAFPSWVWTSPYKAKDFIVGETVDNWLTAMPEYDWKFNLSGTKACAVVYAREEYNNDSTYWASDPDPDTPWSDTKFNLLRDTNLSFASAFRGYPPGNSAYLPQRYFYAPGLVECAVEITLTGDALEDFEINLTTTEIRNPNQTDYFTLFAGYSWIDSSVVQTDADDLIVVDAEMYGRTVRAASGKIDQSKEIFLAVKNLTKGTELWCTKAYPILGIDLATLTLALKIKNLVTDTATTYQQNRSGGPTSAYKALSHFGVWIVRSGATKELLYPETMTQENKDALAAKAVFGQRDTIASLLAGNWQLVPLQGIGKEGWSDSTYNTYRRYWAGKKHYYYIDPWVFTDPDWDFHGTDPFNDEGWVRYKTEVAQPSGYEATEQEMFGLMCGLSVNDHLLFCDNPRWGWHAYLSIPQYFLRNHATVTFWSHPNGSFAFWSSAMIYDSNGCPALDVSTALFPSNIDALAAYEANQVEHCIFDRIHLEVRGAKGLIAALDTTFLEMYNQAVQKGLDDDTLEDGIGLMALSDIQGSFEKQTTNTAIDDTYSIAMLQLQYTNPLGRKWYYTERAIQGWYSPDVPPFEWPPINCANILDFGFDTLWYEQPYNETDPMYASPIDTPQASDPFTYCIRFCNPQILMG